MIDIQRWAAFNGFWNENWGEKPTDPNEPMPLEKPLLKEASIADYRQSRQVYRNRYKAKQIAVDMAAAVTKLDRRNQELMKEIDRLNEEVQLLELKIKK